MTGLQAKNTALPVVSFLATMTRMPSELTWLSATRTSAPSSGSRVGAETDVDWETVLAGTACSCDGAAGSTVGSCRFAQPIRHRIPNRNKANTVLFMSSILPMDWEKWVITEVTLHSKGITQATDVLPPLSTRINHDDEECSCTCRTSEDSEIAFLVTLSHVCRGC